MQPETVYNPTTIASQGERSHYLDGISNASLSQKRCCTVAIAVVAVISSLLGLALVLYGSFFHYHFTSGPASESAAQRERRLWELGLYRILLGVGLPLLALATALWSWYLYRKGRCRHCMLCPGARKRRRLRNNFQTQCLEAGNLSSSFTSRPSHQLSQEEDRLVNQSLDEHSGLEDTDAMLDSGPRPVLRVAKGNYLQPAI